MSSGTANFFNSTVRQNATVILGADREDLIVVLRYRFREAGHGKDVEALDDTSPAGERERPRLQRHRQAMQDMHPKASRW